MSRDVLWDGSFHWGEWCEPGEPGPAGDPIAWFTADKGEVGTAYLYRSVSTLATIAGERGIAGTPYAEIAVRIRDAWRTGFLDTGMRTQANRVRALAFGLVPAERRAEIADRLVALVRDTAGPGHTVMRTGAGEPG
ncbi:hypothetical protein [Actinoplanes utahensis]|uniref:Alpha-L-rhamnosidase six-hairpin glycosidase domain-containing protein n=1 Tax=Actinoplanes utahensis TaxID=1869 RepID=A0A0A6UMK9_ACTUT|nr:hypothetical protein [Actinoplanes utahensis]KHD75564.1 hypothetical protein MB27_22395 [Actinoplanes utahensis]GIF32374.1 hypothetical protein Aut01nite_53600 [Actinoplanes utahensis]